jgi:hypothetical protein
MSFLRKRAAWATGNQLSLKIANAIDRDLALAFDKVGGEIVMGASEWQETLTMHTGTTTPSVGWRISPLPLNDANLNASVDEYFGLTAPAGTTVFTLRHTGSVVPVSGARIHVAFPTLWVGGPHMAFQREDTTEIARIASSGNGGWVGFSFTDEWVCSGAGGDGSRTL